MLSSAILFRSINPRMRRIVHTDPDEEHSSNVPAYRDLKRALVRENLIPRPAELKRGGARVAAYAPGWSVAAMITVLDRRPHQEPENRPTMIATQSLAAAMLANTLSEGRA